MKETFLVSQTVDEDRIGKHIGKMEQTYFSWGQKRIPRRIQKKLVWMREGWTILSGVEGSGCDMHKY